MAKKTIETVIDDLDGSEDATTYRFSYGNQDYEIDLGPKNAEKLDRALMEFIPHSRRLGKSVRGFKASGKREKVDVAAIRAWGKSLPREEQAALFPSEKGALRKAALQAYNDVHGSGSS